MDSIRILVLEAALVLEEPSSSRCPPCKVEGIVFVSLGQRSPARVLYTLVFHFKYAMNSDVISYLLDS